MITPQIRHLANEAKRNQTHCKRGHPLSGENLYRRKDGRRICKTCKKMNAIRKNEQRRDLSSRLIQRILERMDERSLTIAELAAIVGLERHTLGRWLNGDRNLSETKFNAVLDVLELCE